MSPEIFKQAVVTASEAARRQVGPETSPEELAQWGRAVLVASQYVRRFELQVEEAATITFGKIRAERIAGSVNVKTFRPDGTVEQGKERAS